MLLAATGIEFTEAEALTELHDGGCVWVAPEGSKFGPVLAELQFDWQDMMTVANGNLGEDVAYVQADCTELSESLHYDVSWTVIEPHATATFDTPEEALSAAKYGNLRQWLIVRALKEGPRWRIVSYRNSSH